MLDRKEKKEKGCKRNRGAKAFNGRVYPIYRKGIGAMVFEVRGMRQEVITKRDGHPKELGHYILFL